MQIFNCMGGQHLQPAHFSVVNCIYHNFSVHSPIMGQLGGFPVLTIINNAAVCGEAHLSFLLSVFSALGYIPRNGLYLVLSLIF